MFTMQAPLQRGKCIQLHDALFVPYILLKEKIAVKSLSKKSIKNGALRARQYSLVH